jgi:hypothetical protein
VDPISLCLLAAGLVKQIQAGCDLYREAKTQFIQVKKTADEVIAIGMEAKGFFAKLVQFFNPAPAKAASLAPTKVAAKKKEKLVDVDEQQILNDVVARLIEFFHIQEQLAAHIREEEEKSRTVYDPSANLMEAAIKRVRAQDQMDQLVVTIREAMTWNAPAELGALYTKVFEMREIVGAEQEAARLAQESIAKRKRWQRQQREADLNLKIGASLLTLALIVYLWMWLLWLKQARIL